MIINLSPVLGDESVEASVEGDVITVNGQSFDFTPLKKGQVLPIGAVDSPYFLGPVIRLENDQIELTLRLPYKANASENITFPEPIAIIKGGVTFPQNQNLPAEPEYQAPAEQEVITND